MDKTIFYDISYGMYVITTNYEGKNVGCIANSFCQITSVDNIVSISLNKQNFTNTAIKQTKKFALSIISENTNSELIGKFGFYSSKDVEIVYTDKEFQFTYSYLITKVSQVRQIYKLNPAFVNVNFLLQLPTLVPEYVVKEILSVIFSTL